MTPRKDPNQVGVLFRTKTKPGSYVGYFNIDKNKNPCAYHLAVDKYPLLIVPDGFK